MQYVLHFKMPEMALDSHCVILRQRGKEEESKRSNLRIRGFDGVWFAVHFMNRSGSGFWLVGTHLIFPTHDFLGKV